MRSFPNEACEAFRATVGGSVAIVYERASEARDSKASEGDGRTRVRAFVRVQLCSSTTAREFRPSRRLVRSPAMARRFAIECAKALTRANANANASIIACHGSSHATHHAIRRMRERVGNWRVTRAREFGTTPPGPGYGGVVGASNANANAAHGFDSTSYALWGLICANAGVYYAWNTTDAKFMQKHFTVSEESLHRGRYWTLATSAFSHYDMTHLGMNMIALYFFGRSVCERFGGRYLLALYCVGGVGASAAHVAWCRRSRERRIHEARRGGNIFDRIDDYVWRFVEERSSKRGYYFTPAALGASGAVNAIVAFEILLYPMRTIYLYAIIPVPSILLGGLFLLRDVVGMQDGGSGVAHAGHLGGAAVGVLALTVKKLRRFR